MPNRAVRLWLIAAVVPMVLGVGALALLRTPAATPEAAGQPVERPALGLFTSLPIVWNEAPDIAAMLKDSGPPHWAKAVLEERYRLQPLDVLAPAGSLGGLLVAQPRPFSPDENVALDNWVRAGGRLLLLADPMATYESRFALGDRRRPQDTVLLSPILGRWGLSLEFDEDQPAGERVLAGLPVNLPGRLVAAPGGFESRCAIDPAALIADCTIGQGRALVVADAALLDAAGNGAAAGDGPARKTAFATLLDRAFQH